MCETIGVVAAGKSARVHFSVFKIAWSRCVILECASSCVLTLAKILRNDFAADVLVPPTNFITGVTVNASEFRYLAKLVLMKFTESAAR